MRAYNKRKFQTVVNDTPIVFYCETHDTRMGFCHVVDCPDLEQLSSKPSTTRVSYYNRTWERFDYETALRQAIAKFPKAMQPDLKEFIECIARGEQAKCEREFEAFKRLHDGLTDKQKEILAKSAPLQSERDVQVTMGVMGMMNVINKLGV
jgi:hypothetical protein